MKRTPHQLTYTVKIERAEEGGYNVVVPALPGCHTQADTYAEALVRAEEAILCYVEGLQKLGKPIPEERDKPAEVRMNIRLPALA